MEVGKDFIINSDGSVTLLTPEKAPTKEQEEEKILSKERSDLEEEIFSHPERSTPEELAQKKQRFEELTKILGMDSKKSANAFAEAKARLRAMVAQQQSGPNIADIVAQQKQND